MQNELSLMHNEITRMQHELSLMHSELSLIQEITFMQKDHPHKQISIQK